jgi:hypothetical protein
MSDSLSSADRDARIAALAERLRKVMARKITTSRARMYEPTMVNVSIADLESVLAELRAALSREAEAAAGFAYLFGEIGFPLRHRWGGDAKEFTEGVLIAARSVSLSENG